MNLPINKHTQLFIVLPVDFWTFLSTYGNLSAHFNYFCLKKFWFSTIQLSGLN